MMYILLCVRSRIISFELSCDQTLAGLQKYPFKRVHIQALLSSQPCLGIPGGGTIALNLTWPNHREAKKNGPHI